MAWWVVPGDRPLGVSERVPDLQMVALCCELGRTFALFVIWYDLKAAFGMIRLNYCCVSTVVVHRSCVYNKHDLSLSPGEQ